MQISRYRVKISRLKHIFISHLHGDHYLGLVGLLSTLNLRNRKEDLFVFGPSGLDDIITMHLKYTETVLGYKVHFTVLDPENPEIIVDNDLLVVSTIPMDHRIPCTGFLFKEKPRKYRLKKGNDLSKLSFDEINTLKSGVPVQRDNQVKYSLEDYTLPPLKPRAYAYCSDTRYNESIIPYIESVDLLYHESTFLSDQEERAFETFHSSARQAANIALKANVSKLILGHFSIRYKNLEPLLSEAREVFANSYLAIEGQKINIELDNYGQEA
ncbi:MAG: ribonuclease Z [Cyclobacteriaceae bacterium]|nr:MAG: ribonuclease Z [Cyclobacteriaceae bacterium]